MGFLGPQMPGQHLTAGQVWVEKSTGRRYVTHAVQQLMHYEPARDGTTVMVLASVEGREPHIFDWISEGSFRRAYSPGGR